MKHPQLKKTILKANLTNYASVQRSPIFRAPGTGESLGELHSCPGGWGPLHQSICTVFLSYGSIFPSRFVLGNNTNLFKEKSVSTLLHRTYLTLFSGESSFNIRKDQSQ